jgi:hypothetical protein
MTEIKGRNKGRGKNESLTYKFDFSSSSLLFIYLYRYIYNIPMLLRIENSFVQLTNKLGKPFSEEDKEKLARSLELNYDKIRLAISAQENAKEQAKPAIIELGNIGSRFFALNIYYSRDEIGDDIPMSIRQLLPSQSPVHIDIMATTTATSSTTTTTTILQSSDDLQEKNYLKVGEVYDDGDIHSHYIKEIKQEDQGIRPIDNK